MNKGIVKLELITEWICLIIWLTYSLVIFIIFSVSLSQIMVDTPYYFYAILILTFISYILISINLIFNIKNTQIYLKKINQKPNSTPVSISSHKYAHIMITEIIFISFIIFWLTVVYTISLGFTYFTFSFLEDLTDSLLFLVAFYIIIFGGIFLNINTLPIIRKLLEHKKLNRLNISCLVCSVLINLGILAFILRIVNLVIH